MECHVWANYFFFTICLSFGYWLLFYSDNPSRRIMVMRGARIPKPREHTRYIQSVHDVTNLTHPANRSLERTPARNRSASNLTHVTNPPQNGSGDKDSTWRIDLDIATPSIDELFERLVVVTSFSSNHFNEALGFIWQVQKYMPNKTIIVYDLGLRPMERARVTRLCSVQLRSFPFADYPPYFRKLTTYAFKPTIINLALDEFGVIYYGDASIRFHKSAKVLLPIAVEHHGFLGHIRCFNPKLRGRNKGCIHDYALTKAEVYPILGVNRTEVYNANNTVPAISGGLMLLVNSTYLQERLMKPWKKCAADRACIAPKGASLRNHRFDQSALTLIAYKNMYKEFTPENDPTEIHVSVATIKRGRKPQYHPFECPHLANTPKNTTS